jgi:hypothetical protein
MCLSLQATEATLPPPPCRCHTAIASCVQWCLYQQTLCFHYSSKPLESFNLGYMRLKDSHCIRRYIVTCSQSSVSCSGRKDGGDNINLLVLSTWMFPFPCSSQLGRIFIPKSKAGWSLPRRQAGPFWLQRDQWAPRCSHNTDAPHMDISGLNLTGEAVHLLKAGRIQDISHI